LLTQPGFQRRHKRRALFLAHPKTLFGALAVDTAFDIEQGVDALDRFERDWRDHRRALAAPGIGRDIRQLEELSAGVGPTKGGSDRSRRARGIVQLVVAAVGVSLQDTGEAVKMPYGMLVPAIARGIVESGRRRTSSERPIVADIGPDVPLDRLALGQDRHGGVIAVQPFGRQNMALDQRMKRLQNRRTGADLVGQCRQAQINALSPVALALAVQRLVLTELLEQNHRQQLRSGKPTRRHMERCGRLGNRLAIPARELLAHCLDHLPLARNHLQRLSDVLAQLRQLLRSTAGTALRRRDHHALAWQMSRKRFAGRPLALERLHGLRPRRRLLGRQFILGCYRFQLFELKLHLLQQARLALRAGAVKLAPQLLDLELEMTDECFRARQVRLGIGSLGLGTRRFCLGARRDRLRLHAGSALGKYHRMRGGKIGRK
jgi:hypothetical protein